MSFLKGAGVKPAPFLFASLHLNRYLVSVFDFENRARPILKWAGGKSSLLTQLIRKFPDNFERYVEPFYGSGACFLALTKSMPSLLNDSNEELVHLYKIVKNHPEKLMKELDTLASLYSETFFYNLRQTILKDPIKRAGRTVFLNKSGFNGLYRQNSKGGFNVPFGKRSKCPRLYDRENLLLVSKKLKSATLTCLDFQELVDKCGPGDFIYCDPPYEPLNRTASFTSYTAGGFPQEEQLRLKHAAKRAAARGAIVAISNSSADYILDIYGDCKISRIRARRAINSKGHLRGKIDEVLVLI